MGLYDDVRSLVLSVRRTISRGVDLLQVHTNHEIGRRIVEQEQHGSDRAEYGKEILKDLSARLTAEGSVALTRVAAVWLAAVLDQAATAKMSNSLLISAPRP